MPGLIGVILTMTMVMLTAMAIARERERGTLEQLIVSPVRPRRAHRRQDPARTSRIGYVQMTLDPRCSGGSCSTCRSSARSPLLYALAFVFIAANLALGLFFSTLAKTQQQAMQMSFFFLLPEHPALAASCSRSRRCRVPAQWLAQALPLTHFLRIVRGIVLKGAGSLDVAGEVLWLGVILLALMTLTSLRFRKKIV